MSDAVRVNLNERGGRVQAGPGSYPGASRLLHGVTPRHFTARHRSLWPSPILSARPLARSTCSA